MVVSVQASSADELTVRLADGRVQVLRVSGLEGNGGHMVVEANEYTADGRVIRSERTAS
ncbi:hypothetical protein D3C81_2109660 [compost metagenome]